MFTRGDSDGSKLPSSLPTGDTSDVARLILWRLQGRAVPGPPLPLPKDHVLRHSLRSFLTINIFLSEYIYCSSLSPLPSRERQHVCARACARAHTHARLIYLQNAPGRRTRSFDFLTRKSKLLPCLPVRSRLAPHLVRVHRHVRTLTGCAHVCSHEQESSLSRNFINLIRLIKQETGREAPSRGRSKLRPHDPQHVAILNLKS